MSDKTIKTPDLPVVPYTTCEQYREYMAGTPDDNRNEKHNPVPTDAMTLAELGRKTDEELISIINEMGQRENKSDIRVMYSHGYGFTWTQLTVIAEFKGFICENPGQRKPKYSLSENEDDNAEPSPEGIISFSRDEFAYPVEKKLYISKDTSRKLDKIYTKSSTGKPYTNSVKSRILSGIAEKAIDECYHLKKSGKLKFIVKEQEI